LDAPPWTRLRRASRSNAGGCGIQRDRGASGGTDPCAVMTTPALRATPPRRGGEESALACTRRSPDEAQRNPRSAMQAPLPRIAPLRLYPAYQTSPPLPFGLPLLDEEGKRAL